MHLNKKIILITGGSSGIGKSTAKLLTGLGAIVIITGRNPNKLNEVAKELDVFGIHADVSKDEDIKKTYEIIQEKYGRLDVLINNAGIGTHLPIENLERSDFNSIFQTNVFGVAIMTKYAAEMFKSQGSGTVINIGSTSGLNGYKTGSAYSASKFALRGLTQCLQAELRPHNIRVILVNPSEVPTAFGSENRVERPNVPKKITPLEIAHTIVSALSMDDRGMIPEVTVWATNPW